MTPFLVVFPLALLVSCAQVSLPVFGRPVDPTRIPAWREYDTEDYVAQLASLEGVALRSQGLEILSLSPGPRRYLEGLATTILQNNEIFFPGRAEPRVHVIQDARPYHFSLPGRVLFMSTGLINKYLKHEAILASVMSYELVRSEKKLYAKTLIVPVGYLSVERLLGISRLDGDDKIGVHKWAYHALRRSGFDGEYYLSWLQTMNRNAADFVALTGDATSISREEAMFKAFLVRRTKFEDERAVARRDSSKEFYAFLFNVKDKTP